MSRLSRNGRRFLAVGALGVLAIVAAACGDDDADPEAQPPSTSAAQGAATSAEAGATTSAAASTDAPTSTEATDTTAAPDALEDADRNAVFRFAWPTGVNSFDPHRSPASQGDQAYLRPVYDRLLTLVRTDEGVELAPQLATSYDVADDALSIEFELRDDVVFQDGAPFDANTVKANIERALDPQSTVSSLLAAIASVEVVDPTHVVFHLKVPDPSVPWSMATGTTGMMISPDALNNPDLSTTPVGSGPYQLVSATKDADVVYERWDGYWDPDAVIVAELTISTITDGNVRFNGTQSDEFDAAYMSTPQDSQAKSLESDGFHWHQWLSPVSYGVLMNSSMPPFDDVRVRRAVSMAINRQEITDELLNGLNPPVYQVFGPGYLGHDDSLDTDPYDPEAAAALIQEAGAEGAAVRLIQPLTEPQQSLALVTQQALGDIGLNVELVPLSPTEARSTWQSGGYHGMTAPITGRVDPAVTLRTGYLGGDNPAPPPPELVAMADAAAAIPLDSAERETAYQEISEWLLENPVHVPVVQFSTVILARPEVVGSENIVATGLADIEFRRVGLANS